MRIRARRSNARRTELSRLRGASSQVADDVADRRAAVDRLRRAALSAAREAEEKLAYTRCARDSEAAC